MLRSNVNIQKKTLNLDFKDLRFRDPWHFLGLFIKACQQTRKLKKEEKGSLRTVSFVTRNFLCVKKKFKRIWEFDWK